MRTLFRRGLLLGCLIAPAAARSDNAAQIKIDNFTFGPGKVTVAKGTAVTWTNQARRAVQARLFNAASPPGLSLICNSVRPKCGD